METSSLSRKLTARFVAGRTLGEGINVLQKLANERILATLDHLGENVLRSPPRPPRVIPT